MTATLKIETPKVRQLVEDYRAGRLAIPEFQREYVWKPSRAPKLIDSLFHRFPISVLLVWTGDAERRSRRKEPKPNRSGMIGWLIDGQQRIITLSRVIAGDEGIDVVYNPKLDTFQLRNAATNRDRDWVRVSELFDDETYRQIRRQLQDVPRGAEIEAKFDRVRSIMDYEIPVVRMLDFPFEDAVEAFERINTLGVKLKNEDIAAARVAAKHAGFIADEVIPFVEELRKDGFGRLSVMHLFRACAFVALPDGRARTPLHELSNADVKAAWQRTERGTKDAIQLIRNEFGLVNMDIVWSGALLVPVIALCATKSPRELDQRGLAGWLAMAALLHRYSTSAEAALDQDLKACRAEDAIGALLTNVRREFRFFGAIPDDFQGTLNDKGALLAAYVACRQAGLRDLGTGQRITMQANVDRQHLLPRNLFPEPRRPAADNVANVVFTTSGWRPQTGSPPEVFLAKLSPEGMRSQCIPPNRLLWKVEKAEEFWAARRELLARAFNDRLREVLPGRKIEQSA